MPEERAASLNFETSLEELERIVKELEKGELPLERSLELFESGMRLSSECKRLLEEAESRVEVLTKRGSERSGASFQSRQAGVMTKTQQSSLQEYLAEQVKVIDRALDEWVPAEAVAPESIHRAMRYSLFAGGKRIRPILAIAAGASHLRGHRWD